MDIKFKNKYLIEILAFAFVFFVCASPVLASQISADSVLKLVNKSRESAGLSDLSFNDHLMSAAQDKLNDMIKNDYFAHTSPAGINPWHWFEKDGYNYQYAGENLAINFTTAEDEHKAWMNSPAHKKNILSPNFDEIGIAVGAGEMDGQMSIIAVQEFGAKFGADAVDKKQNFSVNENSNPIQDKLAPQVLSVKDTNSGNSGSGGSSGAPTGESFWSKMFSGFEKNQTSIYELATELFLVILLVSLALAPLAFISIALEGLVKIYERKKQLGSV
jgi:uncharacterized protein YkwD